MALFEVSPANKNFPVGSITGLVTEAPDANGEVDSGIKSPLALTLKPIIPLPPPPPDT